MGSQRDRGFYGTSGRAHEAAADVPLGSGPCIEPREGPVRFVLAWVSGLRGVMELLQHPRSRNLLYPQKSALSVLFDKTPVHDMVILGKGSLLALSGSLRLDSL